MLKHKWNLFVFLEYRVIILFCVQHRQFSEHYENDSFPKTRGEWSTSSLPLSLSFSLSTSLWFCEVSSTERRKTCPSRSSRMFVCVCVFMCVVHVNSLPGGPHKVVMIIIIGAVRFFPSEISGSSLRVYIIYHLYDVRWRV